ncbi:MAG: carboxymuconolactone decarboxylase family protein [Paenibacillaceae bacterium]|nr:carboxymuconolactone decarboxylase family protein [Paenibacillaceae bacterium]
MVDGQQTTEERYARGKQTLIRMVGEEGADKIEDIRRYFPEFGQLLVAFGFGDLYSRSVFDLKQREMITLTSLISQGATEQLPFHLHAALNVGLTPDEILEIVRHCAGYVGFPKACGALDVVRRVFAERGVAGS